jgi:DNA-binding SARP family transcriptional activator/pimeloyl-ACP methyl ester carboxylesterase
MHREGTRRGVDEPEPCIDSGHGAARDGHRAAASDGGVAVDGTATRPRFRVLGPVTLSDGAPLGSPRLRGLLGLLVARAGQVVPSDTLGDELWGDRQPADPAAALYTLVSRLRRLAGADAVATAPGGYRLAAPVADTDVGAFAGLAAQARRADDPAEAVALFGAALGLWRGRAYQDADGVPALRAEAVRLDELRLAAAEGLAAARLDLAGAGTDAGADGELATAAAELAVLIREHPLRDGPRALLMRARYLAGRQPDALAGYRAYRELLAAEIGLEPSAALQRLHAAVLGGDDAVLRPAAVPAGRGSTAGPAPGLTGTGIRYLTAPGARRLAWTTAGQGYPLVAVPAWISSLDVLASGRDPRSSLLDRLSRRFALTLYDRYGTGLSRGEVTDFSLAAAVAELAAVCAAAGGGRPVALLAVSQSGPVAVTLAAQRPGLVSHLVCFGTYADARATFPAPVAAAMVQLVRAHWGTGARTLAELYRPGCTALAARHLGRVLQDSAGREVAAGYLAAGYRYDCSAELSQVMAPALVVHYRGDRVIPFAGGRQLAEGLAGARFLPLAGSYHLPDAPDLDRIVAAVADFLPG